LSGERRQFFAKFAPYSESWQVHTDRSWVGENYLDQAVQIARYYEDTPEAPPQILLRTNGYTGTPSSLGTFAMGKARENQTQVVAVIDTTKVALDLAVAALDPEQAHLLVHFCETALGPLSRFLVNSLLMAEDESKRNWAVTLPIQWTVGALADVPIGEDRKNRLWTTTFSEEVQVEVATWAEYSRPATLYNLGGPRMDSVTITVPSQVRIGTATPLYVSRRPGDAQWKVSDTTLAYVTVNDALFAKKIGRVSVSLISALKPGADPYASAEVQIVP
jgi:hypothetical protein